MVSLSAIGIAMALLALLVAPISAFAPRGGLQTLAPTNSSADDYSGYALLFDDGVIVETEECTVWRQRGIHQVWSEARIGRRGRLDEKYYDILQNTVGGGKPKMKHYFNNEVKFWPTVDNFPVGTEDEQSALVDALQDAKVEAYKKIIEDGAECRPGIKDLMDAAIADPNLKVGICTAATKGGFYPLVDALLGQERLKKLDVLIVGDDVEKKKPDPMIYNTARERLGLDATKCVVIEDSMVGLRAMRTGMNCIITYTENTASADFYGEGADAKCSPWAASPSERSSNPY